MKIPIVTALPYGVPDKAIFIVIRPVGLKDANQTTISLHISDGAVAISHGSVNVQPQSQSIWLNNPPDIEIFQQNVHKLERPCRNPLHCILNLTGADLGNELTSKKWLI